MQEMISLLFPILCTFLTLFFTNLCYAQLTGKKLVFNKRNSLIIIITMALIIINNVYMTMELKAASALLIMIISLKLLFKDSIKKTFIIYLVIYVIMLLFEILISNIMLAFNSVTLTTFALNNTKLALSILIALLQYILIKIPIVKRTLLKLITITSSIATLMNVVYLLMISILVIGAFNVYNYESNGSYKIIAIILILFTILFIFLITTIVNSNMLKLTNNKLIDYNEKYSKFLDEYKIYKHNIKNKLISIKSYGNKKVNDLIDSLIEEETSFTIKNNNLYNIPNGIKGIAAEKLYNSNINVFINNKLKKDPFINLSPKAFNSISECLGIALDNALEASKDTKEPIITLDLNEDEENILIKIGNNFCNNINLEKLGDKYYSTKNRGSGLGLFSIKRNKLVQEKITIINDFYYIELQIKKAR